MRLGNVPLTVVRPPSRPHQQRAGHQERAGIETRANPETRVKFFRRRAIFALAAVPFLLSAAAAHGAKSVKKTAQTALAALVGARPAHHLPGGIFGNSDGKAMNKPFYHLLKWRLEAPSPPLLSFPLAQNNPRFLQTNRRAPTLTWVGHCTLLLQVGGVNILTDPHFSRRASPLSFAGPLRGTPPGIAFEDLPPLDVVLVSHSHYDHCDADTLKKIAAAHKQAHFVAPLKLGQVIADEVAAAAGVSAADFAADKVHELDWGQAVTIGGARIIAEPSYHWSARGLFDRNKTLWANYVIETLGASAAAQTSAQAGAVAGERFLFIGDTGYSPDYAALGEKYGGFDFAAIPIGAYAPRWFMKDVHVNPQEAARIFQDTRAARALGIHWGVFQLTDEPLDEPPLKLKQALAAAGIDQARFMVWQHGESRHLHTLEKVV